MGRGGRSVGVVKRATVVTHALVEQSRAPRSCGLSLVGAPFLPLFESDLFFITRNVFVDEDIPFDVVIP